MFHSRNIKFDQLGKILAIAVRRTGQPYEAVVPDELIIQKRMLTYEAKKFKMNLVGAILSDPTESLAVVKW